MHPHLHHCPAATLTATLTTVLLPPLPPPYYHPHRPSPPRCLPAVGHEERLRAARAPRRPRGPRRPPPRRPRPRGARGGCAPGACFALASHCYVFWRRALRVLTSLLVACDQVGVHWATQAKPPHSHLVAQARATRPLPSALCPPATALRPASLRLALPLCTSAPPHLRLLAVPRALRHAPWRSALPPARPSTPTSTPASSRPRSTRLPSPWLTPIRVLPTGSLSHGWCGDGRTHPTLGGLIPTLGLTRSPVPKPGPNPWGQGADWPWP